MNALEKRLTELNGVADIIYEQEVIKLIRKKYSLSNELAILRQRDSKPNEFNEYNEYVESCKQMAKSLLK